MSESNTKVALVIPVHNRRETTLQGLRSLHSIKTTGLELKTFLVDDGSTDGTSEAVAHAFPMVEILHGDGSLHYAGGTNRGIEAALAWDAEFIVTMNDDSVFHDEFLLRLVETARSEPGAIVGALLLLWNEPHRVFQVGLKWNSLAGGWVVPQHLTAFSVPENAFEVECLVGNCVLFPSEAIRENGLMDETNFAHGWGDAQYAMRMRKAGRRLLVDPRSRVWCEPNTYPTPLHREAAGAVIRNLFLNKRHPMNLGRQFTALWHSAPSRPQALVAFAATCARLALKAARVLPFAPRTHAPA